MPQSNPPSLLTELEPGSSEGSSRSAIEEAIQGTLARLRAELEKATEPVRRSRLLAEIGEIEERSGDASAGARDWLAAYNADPSFREPLEGLLRVFDRRRSTKNLGKLIEPLAFAAETAEEKARAFGIKAGYQFRYAEDIGSARQTLKDASELDVSATEKAVIWLAAELLAARAGDSEGRGKALGERAKLATTPLWRGLLALDHARLLAAAGDIQQATRALEQIVAAGDGPVFDALFELERLTLRDAGTVSESGRQSMRALARLFEQQAQLVSKAIHEPDQKEMVPTWARHTEWATLRWLRAAASYESIGALNDAKAAIEQANELAKALSPFAQRAVRHAQLHLANIDGDIARLGELADSLLAKGEEDPKKVAWLEVIRAERALQSNDGQAAADALQRAHKADSGSIAAEALRLDLLANGSPQALASELESYADALPSDEAKARFCLLAALVWATGERDPTSAKAALSQAALLGAAPSLCARLARTLASICEDTGWYEDASRRLLATPDEQVDPIALHVELLRARLGRNDVDGTTRTLQQIVALPQGVWLGSILEAFLPDRWDPERTTVARWEDRRRRALEHLAEHVSDPDLARGMQLLVAIRLHAAGDLDAAKAQLKKLLDANPRDPLTAAYAIDLERATSQPMAAADIAIQCAAASHDPELATALYFEAGFERWKKKDTAGALSAFEDARALGTPVADVVLAWALRAVAAQSIEAKRRAADAATDLELPPSPDRKTLNALERFALEWLAGEESDAVGALAGIDCTAKSALLQAAGLASVLLPDSQRDEISAAYLDAVGESGTRGSQLAATERLRLAFRHDAAKHAEAARAWLEAGGGIAAALEGIAANASIGNPEGERAARISLAAELEGAEREVIIASAAMVDIVRNERSAALLEGTTPAVRLTNLELAPPGVDPRRRAFALDRLGTTAGDDTELDALALAGWSLLVSGDAAGARDRFAQVVAKLPWDLASWEGLRSAAETAGDLEEQAIAASELGRRLADPTRASVLSEEAALLWFELGNESQGEAALETAFARDPNGQSAFDKLFRRVRDRKDGDRVLALAARRLEFTEDPDEMTKLFWEQARTFRAKSDYDAALKALENVTILEPNHIGALALTGEIAIKRGLFNEAATALAHLSTLEDAPAKNRLTAGIAAVDLLENKLSDHRRAFDVLGALHRANLSPLPVRERLARTAARVGAWRDATQILEELMRERTERDGRIEAARLALAIYRDRLNAPVEARDAVLKILAESPGDGDALDMLPVIEPSAKGQRPHLINARAALLSDVAIDPTDVTAARKLIRVARGLGDEALQQAALSVSIALSNAVDPHAEQQLSALAGRKGRLPQVAFTDPDLRRILAPGDDGPIAELFVFLARNLADSLGPSLSACGVTRRDRIDPKSGVSVRNDIATWAGAFGIHDFELYVGGRDPQGVAAIANEVPALVIGPAINSPLTPLSRARIARELLGLLRGTTVLRLRDENSILAIVVAACKFAEIPIQHPPLATLNEIEKALHKSLSRKQRRPLAEICKAIVNGAQDPRRWAGRALMSQSRMAAIAAGDIGIVLRDDLGEPSVVGREAWRRDPRVEEICRFVLSAPYLELREQLGLEGAR